MGYSFEYDCGVESKYGDNHINAMHRNHLEQGLIALVSRYIEFLDRHRLKTDTNRLQIPNNLYRPTGLQLQRYIHGRSMDQ